MPAFLIEPTDVLFFRDGIPMSAGQGRGSGCRMPFPSTLHEALRASLFAKYGRTDTGAAFRPKDAPRKRRWLGQAKSEPSAGSKNYQSLTVIGPLPWHEALGLLLPVPLDVAFSEDRKTLARPQLGLSGAQSSQTIGSGRYEPLCLPLATTPPDKHGALHGWWTVSQYLDYLRGETSTERDRFKPIPTDTLWQPEYRIGVEIDPQRAAAVEGRLFAGTYLRMDDRRGRAVKFCFQADLRDRQAAENGEGKQLAGLDWLLLGGERRLSRLCEPKKDPFAALRSVVPLPPVTTDGPVVLKWSLVTPAIFAHGSLPGWCFDSKKDRPDGPLPTGRVCFDLPGKATLVSWCLGRPQTVTGWDLIQNKAKPTQLAVPAGSVYYFLCESRATATALANKLHWQPRSDHYGEKGCGYGLVSFDTQWHSVTSPDVPAFARQLFAS